MAENEERSQKAHWPYKQLWNLLRGESVVADDEVILEELKQNYELIILGLTQYSRPEEDPNANNEEPDSPEDKIKSRIACYLDIEETVAWDLFVSYMMYEYKGGSMSYKTIVSSPKLCSDLLHEVKRFYHQERICILLCLQALLGHLNESGHKYNHIFEAFKEWADEHGAEDLTTNLLKSLDNAMNANEEIQVLHTLTTLMFVLPHLSIRTFLEHFAGFKPGRKNPDVLMAESAVLYVALLVPGFPSPEFPEEFKEGIEKFLLENTAELLTNRFSMGAVLGGFVSACQENRQVQELLTTCPFQSSQCVRYMVELANHYNGENPLNRHNLSEFVLTGVYDAARAMYDNLDQAVPKFGKAEDFFNLLIASLKEHSISTRFLSDQPDIMNLYTEASVMFPLDIQHMIGMWSSICSSVADPEDSANMLNDLTKLINTIAEYSSDPAYACSFPLRGENLSRFRNTTNRIIAGIMIPRGCEMGYLIPTHSEEYIVAWDLKDRLPISLWTVIYHEVLKPVIRRIREYRRGPHLEDRNPIWDTREHDNVFSIVNFLSKNALASDEIAEIVEDLFEPLAFVLFNVYDFVRSMKDKAIMCSHLLDIVSIANKSGEKNWTHSYLNNIWPGELENTRNLTEEVIMGYESVAMTECRVTISFLQSILRFFKETGGNVEFSSRHLAPMVQGAIIFLNDNVFHSFTRWRIEDEEIKFKVLINCLQVYNRVFSLPESEWQDLKRYCSNSLLKSGSSLMSVLGTDEMSLQESVIHPAGGKQLLPVVIYESLGLLLKLFFYRKDTMATVDITLGKTLVQKLGRFARHRLDHKIPTLAMSVLKKIAEERTMSLLSCFGGEEIAFRDLILQRIEFRSEDVNLKVAILEFLTVAAQTQPGLIQHIFQDEVLAEKIVDLPMEKDEGLSLSVLLFLRALFRKGATVMKKCHHLWENVFSPIKLLNHGGRVKIITCTLNIATMELFHCGTANPEFTSELKHILEEKFFISIVKIALKDQSEIGVKCLQGIIHFLTVIITRNDLAESFQEKTRKAVLDLVTEEYWNNKDMDEEAAIDPKIAAALVELMCLLEGSVGEYPEYLNELSSRLSTEFLHDSVASQVSLLRLTNDCLKKATKPVPAEAVENVIRVVSKVFLNAAKIFEYSEVEKVYPILCISAVIVCTIIKSDHCSNWENCFQQHLLTSLVVSVANRGFKHRRGPQIVTECLTVMIDMADKEKALKMLEYADLENKIWIPVVHWASPDVNDPAWEKVYLMCVHLMTKLLNNKKRHFLKNSLNFWVMHGPYLIHKLNSLSDMTKQCIMNSPEKNFDMIMHLLSFNVFTLDAVKAMLPYYDRWELKKKNNQMKVMEGVFVALQTAVNLIQQPHFLNVLITFPKVMHVPPPQLIDVKLTPQQLELQAKLRQIIEQCCHILWSLRIQLVNTIPSDAILSTVHQVAQACVKALHSRKSHGHGHFQLQPGGRIEMTLEKALCLFIYHGQLVIHDENRPLKAIYNLRRELTSDVSTLCDSIYRINGNCKTDLLGVMCTNLEGKFK